MMTLRIKTKSGAITEMAVEELIEIDGKPYKSAGEYQELRDAVMHLDGRVSGLESALYERVSHG